MSTFVAVIVGIIVTVLILGSLAWAAMVWLIAGIEEWGWRTRTKILHSVGGIVLAGALIALVIDSGFFSDDNASHCGPGTRYVEESHYNPATKTVITDWMCVL